MPMMTDAMRTMDAVRPAASMLDALGDATRLSILLSLRGAEHRVADLVAVLGLAQSTVSEHLACLRGCGLVTSRQVGRASFYRLEHPHELESLLAAADLLLEATGYRVVLCASNHCSAR